MRYRLWPGKITVHVWLHGTKLKWIASRSPRHVPQAHFTPYPDILKVEKVVLFHKGQKVEGSVHLTPHHIIFTFQIPDGSKQGGSSKAAKREKWITYPMICFCTYRPAPISSHTPPSIRLRCRDFSFYAFHFHSDSEARDVYDSIRSLTCRLGRIEKLYAFSYKPHGPEKEKNGWEIYDARKEWKRLGLDEEHVDRAWRISTINQDYQVSKR